MALLLVEAGGSRSSWYLLGDGRVQSQYDGAALNAATTSDRSLSSEEIGLCRSCDSAVVYLAGFDGSAEMINYITNLLGVNNTICYSDLHAVWHAFDRRDGIFCLLGTGSQSFRVQDGSIAGGRPSLGYLVSDEGSGYAMGRSFLRKYMYGQLPSEVVEKVSEKHNLERSHLIRHLYKEGRPATFMASFSHIVSQYRETDWAREIIYSCLRSFVDLRVSCFSDIKGANVCAAGSIAAVYAKELRDVLTERDYQLLDVIASPSSHLINHYLS